MFEAIPVRSGYPSFWYMFYLNKDIERMAHFSYTNLEYNFEVILAYI